ncbi:MAG TPA: M28 family peptidase, partial [Candidatus Deferrimicrobium sp.]|nr:M28 family peptidase [Candidatus Deferrimicrobium sp.]
MSYSDIAAQNAYQFTAKLAFPRLVGTEGEARAQALIESELETIGNYYFSESLKASAFPIGFIFRITMPLGAIILLITWLYSDPLVGLNNPWFSLIFGLGGTLLLLFSSTIVNRSFGVVPPFGRIYETKNYIAEITPPNPQAHLIYMAHYDSKSQFFPVLVRIILFLGGLISGLLYGMRVIIGSIIRLSGTLPSRFWMPDWSSFLIVFLFNFPLIFNFIGNKSPGAIDNATSVATVLELSKIFKNDPPKHLKLTFLITAAEELGLYGAAD